jgi:hypothetical protein
MVTGRKRIPAAGCRYRAWECRLTNEAVIPIGQKDYWNSLTPYQDGSNFDSYFCNPELGLYMDDSLFGGAVPALSALRIQRNAYTILGNVDFGNGHDGLNVIKGHPATAGTALDTNIFGNYLLRAGQPAFSGFTSDILYGRSESRTLPACYRQNCR